MRRRTGRNLATATMALVVVAGLPAAPALAATVEVDILGSPNRFEPDVVVIDPGDTVHWTNNGGIPHTVTSNEPGVLESGSLADGDDYSKVFPSTGETYTVDYFCEFHSNMEGQVVVAEDPPVLSIADRNALEGSGQLAFTVSLSYPPTSPVTVEATTADGTATAGEDYTATSTEVAFDAGQDTALFIAPVLDDDVEEDAETLTVTLSGATGATIGDGEATGTIVDDDGADPLQVPTADAGGPYTATEELPVTLSSEGSTDADGEVASVAWDLDGDGTFETEGETVTTSFADDGDEEIAVEVTDDDGLTDVDTAAVTVRDIGVVTRSSGPDRIQTAVALSADHWTVSDEVVLATAAAFPDALAAGALAARLDSPLLLTGADTLHPAVADELGRLEATTVLLLGGEGAISMAVADQLRDLGLVVDRLGGDSRFATAAMVAERAGPSATGEVVVALGQHLDPGRDAWPDALSAGSLAASSDRLPTLLTRSDRLPDETRSALAALGATDVVLLGGEGAIGLDVATELAAMGLDVRRHAGADRFATSALAAADALERAAPGDVPVVFATGHNFPDGLAAGALAAHLDGLLLLVPPDQLDVEGPTGAMLAGNARRIDHGVVSGGGSAVSEAVRAGLAAAMTASG